jgi:hypothetical protein
MTREGAIDEAVRAYVRAYGQKTLRLLRHMVEYPINPHSDGWRFVWDGIRAEFRRIMERERSTDYLRRMGYPVG